MVEVCRLILNRDKFNSNEIDRKAALLYTAEYDYPRVIRELSFKVLDLDLTDNEGKTAVSYANQNRSMDALCELIGEWAIGLTWMKLMEKLLCFMLLNMIILV